MSSPTSLVPVRVLRLLISAVEPSGDRLAAELVEELGRRGPVEARGLAGPTMRAAGVRALACAERVAVNGIWEVLAHLPDLRRASAVLRAEMDWPDLAIFVDAPDFHLRLASRARARGLGIVGYVSPQVWAWRPGRARTIARSYDRLLCLFPFEPAFYAAYGMDARYVGHPLVDRLAGAQAPCEPGLLALLPGSRRSEIRRLLPVFLEVARELRSRDSNLRFRVGRAGDWLPAWEEACGTAGVEIVDGLVQAAASAEAALVASGTATLELAILGVPMVVAYQVHPTTYLVGRLLVKGIRHIGLPNILAGRGIAPEHIQHLDPVRIADDLIQAARGREQVAGLAEVRDILGPPGASVRAATAIQDLLPLEWSGRSGGQPDRQPSDIAWSPP